MNKTESNLSSRLTSFSEKVVAYLNGGQKNTNGINPEQELKVNHSIIDTSWNRLCTRLNIDEKNQKPILSEEEESNIRAWSLSKYTDTNNDFYVNPILKFYTEAKDELIKLSEMINEKGDFFEQIGYGQNLDTTFNNGVFFRFLDGLPLHTPEIAATIEDVPKPVFYMPLENDLIADSVHPLYLDLESTGIRGLGNKYYRVVYNEEENKALVDTIIQSPSLMRLFLAEQLALDQELLVHNVRAMIN